MAAVFKIIYDSSNPAAFSVLNNTGLALPYAQSQVKPIWDQAAQTLELRYAHYDYTPILSATIYSSIQLSTDGGSTFAAPATFADLVAWVTTYLFKGTSGGGSGGDATAANQTTEIARLTAITGQLPSSLGNNAIADSLCVNIADGSVVTEGGMTINSKVIPAITAGSAYVQGNAVGGVQTFTDVFRINGGTGTIVSLVVLDKANQKAKLDVYLFSRNPIAGSYTDKNSPIVSGADFVNLLHKITVLDTDYSSIGNAATLYAVADIKIHEDIVGEATSANLYAVIVTNSTPTYSSTSDLQLVIGVYQD